MDENQTRGQLIDGQLIKAGWNTKNYNQVVKEFGISSITFRTSTKICGYSIQNGTTKTTTPTIFGKIARII